MAAMREAISIAVKFALSQMTLEEFKKCHGLLAIIERENNE
jgi:hypothetical protein